MGYMGIASEVMEKYDALISQLPNYHRGSEEYKAIAAQITSFERQQILNGNKNFAAYNVIDPLCDMAHAGIDDDYTKEILVDYIVWFKQNGFTEYVNEILKWASADAREVLENA